MLIEVGKTYYGPFNRKRTVADIAGETVTYALPIGLRSETCDLAEMEAWALGEYIDPFA